MPHDDSSFFLSAEIQGIEKNLPIYCDIVKLMLDYKFILVSHFSNWDNLKKRRILSEDDTHQVVVDVESDPGIKRTNPKVTIYWKNHIKYGDGVIAGFNWWDAGMCQIGTEFLEEIRDGLKREGKELLKEAIKIFWRK